MSNPAGESREGVLRLDFDRRVTLQFRGSVVTSDAGLLPYRELDDALGLSAMAGEMLADARTGKNGRHALVGMLRQPGSVGSLGMKMLTTPSARAMIPRCGGLSAAKLLRDAPHRRARWAASRRAGSRRKRTFRRSPIFPANGSMPSMVVVRQEV